MGQESTAKGAKLVEEVSHTVVVLLVLPLFSALSAAAPAEHNVDEMQFMNCIRARVSEQV
jgi:hypothetical protein